MPTTLITPTAHQTATFSSSTATTTNIAWAAWNDTGTSASITTSATSSPWDQWIIQGTTTGTSSATTITATTSNNADAVFVSWVQEGPSTTSTIPDTIFLQWAEDGQTGNHLHRPRVHVTRSAPVLTEEQLAERERQRAERARLDEERRREKAAADDRAMELLQSVLTEEQNRDLDREGYFFTHGQSGRLYRIGKGRLGNVKVVDPQTKQWTETLCIHQREYIPIADTMLMQKLMIETAEAHFRAYANISYRDGGYRNGRGGLLTGERLAEVIPFPAERVAA